MNMKLKWAISNRFEEFHSCIVMRTGPLKSLRMLMEGLSLHWLNMFIMKTTYSQRVILYKDRSVPNGSDKISPHGIKSMHWAIYYHYAFRHGYNMLLIT